MSVSPSLPEDCWPFIYPSSCAAAFDPDADGYDADVSEAAQALAVSTLRVLTAYQVGGCPVVLRPATRRCCESTWAAYPVGSPGGPWAPRLDSGQWINVPCGCSGQSCSCGSLETIDLPSLGGTVVSVQIDGATLAPSAWRVLGDQLVRVDGGSWPRTQDLTADPDQPGAFAVTYVVGNPVDALGARAAGMLACEYRKAITGDKTCSLPKNVSQIIRNGVAMTLADPQGRLFPNGLTGIPVVDTYVARWNPHGLKTASTVWSPDTARPPAQRLPDAGVYLPGGSSFDGGSP